MIKKSTTRPQVKLVESASRQTVAGPWQLRWVRFLPTIIHDPALEMRGIKSIRLAQAGSEARVTLHIIVTGAEGDILLDSVLVPGESVPLTPQLDAVCC